MFFRILDWLALFFLVMGGLNTGMVGLFNYDPIIDIAGSTIIVAHIFFFLVGLSAIYEILRIGYVIKMAEL